MSDSPGPEPPRRIVVPGGSRRSEEPTDDNFEGMVSQAEISSASRSCLAIIVGLLIIAGLVCVFLVWRVVA